jgi:hypothetical protein
MISKADILRSVKKIDYKKLMQGLGFDVWATIPLPGGMVSYDAHDFDHTQLVRGDAGATHEEAMKNLYEKVAGK